jgi:hypothetical protein
MLETFIFIVAVVPAGHLFGLPVGSVWLGQMEVLLAFRRPGVLGNEDAAGSVPCTRKSYRTVLQ